MANHRKETDFEDSKEVVIVDLIGNEAGIVERDGKFLLCKRYNVPERKEKVNLSKIELDVNLNLQSIKIGRLTEWDGSHRSKV